MKINSQRLTWVGDELVYGRRTLLRIERDGVYPEMWRVRLPDNGLADMVNRTRAKDAAVSIAHRLLNMSESLSEAPPTAPNDFEGLSDLEAVSASPRARQGTGRKSCHVEEAPEGLPAKRIEAGPESSHSTGGCTA
jgi:hypothetical protein